MGILSLRVVAELVEWSFSFMQTGDIMRILKKENQDKLLLMRAMNGEDNDLIQKCETKNLNLFFNFINSI